MLAALRERDKTGKGQEIQSALFENCGFLSAQHMQQFQMTGEPAPPMPSRVSAWSVYDVFTLAEAEQLCSFVEGFSGGVIHGFTQQRVNADTRYLQAMLGHASLESTQVYTHVSIRKLKEIHSAAHPAARLTRSSSAGDEQKKAERAELLEQLELDAETELHGA